MKRPNLGLDLNFILELFTCEIEKKERNKRFFQEIEYLCYLVILVLADLLLQVLLPGYCICITKSVIHSVQLL